VIPSTRLVTLSITLGAIAAVIATASDKDFRAGAASDYAHQSADHVTVGAKAFNTEDLTAEVFGKKADLLRYGVLPVLVVIENKRGQALDLRDLEVNLVAADGRHATSVNPEDIPFLAKHGRRRPPVQTPIPLPKKGNPLSSPEIVTRAFSAKMLPPGDSANGFFYFEAKSETGDKLYLNGLRDARSGQDVLYFEFPLEQ
jgi:hypothetical protein